MADKYSGSRLNEGIISKLKGRVDSIIEEGRRNASAPDKSSLEKITITKEDSTTEEIYVTAKDKEIYEKINYVKEILDFGEFELSELYDLPGGKIKIGGASSTFRLYLPVIEAPSLVERIMNSKITEIIDIEFPQEFYRLNPYFKDAEGKVPETDMDLPRPKKGDESIEEYEQYLEEEYKKHGIEKTPDAGTKWRMPYPHEKINYRNELDNKDKKSTPGITKVEDSNQSGYYPVYVEHQKKVKGKHRRTGSGRHRVTGSRVSGILGTSYNFIQNLLRGRLVNLGISKYFIGGAAGVAVSTLLLGGGIPSALVAAAMGAGIAKAVDMIRYTLPYKKRKKRTEGPETEGPEGPGGSGGEGGEGGPEEESEVDLSELEAIRTEIEENLKLIQQLHAQYVVKQQKVQELTAEDPEAHKDEIDALKGEMVDIGLQMKEIAGNNETILADYMKSASAKGRSL